jgi:hypothetical protein
MHVPEEDAVRQRIVVHVGRNLELAPNKGRALDIQNGMRGNRRRWGCCLGAPALEPPAVAAVSAVAAATDPGGAK